MLVFMAAVPSSVFNALAGVYPLAVQVFQRADVRPVEAFSLWYIRNHGQLRSPRGRWIVKHSHLSRVLTEDLGIASKSRVAELLTTMVDAGWIERTALTKEELEQWYPNERGRRDALLLRHGGDEVLDGLKAEFSATFGAVLDEQSIVVRSLAKVIAPIAQKLTPRMKEAVRDLKTRPEDEEEKE